MSFPDQTSSEHLESSNFDGDLLTKKAACNRLGPKRFGQLCMKSHAPLSPRESSSPFCCAILLRSLLQDEVTSNALWLARLHEPFVVIFTSVVTTQVLDFIPCLILYFSLPFLGLLKDFRFIPHEVNPDLLWIIIHESDKVASPPCDLVGDGPHTSEWM